MNAATATPLSQRDRAVLRAVAAGRCEISKTLGGNLLVDGVWLTDQFAGPRLTDAGPPVTIDATAVARPRRFRRCCAPAANCCCGHHASKHGPRLQDIGATLSIGC